MSKKKPTLAQAKRDFLADLRAESSWRKAKVHYGDFYDGDQWEPGDKSVLEERGQPAIVINRVKPKIDAIIGIQQAMRVDTKAFPLGEREKEAEFISQELRLSEDCGNFDEHESAAFKDQLIDGLAWYRCSKQLVDGKVLTKAEHIPNDDIVADRHGRKADLSDHKRIHYTVKMHLEDAKAMFPKSAQILEDSALNPTFFDAAQAEHERLRPDQYDPDRSESERFTEDDYAEFTDQEVRMVRVVTTYYRSTEIKKFFSHPLLDEGPIDVSDYDKKSMDTLEISFPNAEVVVQTRKTLNSYTFTWNVELEHLEDLRPYDKEAKYEFVAVPGYRKRRTLEPYGLVKQIMDPQREVNSRRSKMLYLLNTRRTMFPRGAFADPQIARAEINKVDTFLEYNGQLAPTIQENLELSQAQYQLLAEAKGEVDNAGVQGVLEGDEKSQSGRDRQLRHQQALQPIRELFANLREARRRVALWTLDEIIKQNPDLGTVKYDILIEESPESLNLSSETFGQLVSLAQSGLPIPPEMLIEVSPLPTKQKEQFLEKMQAMQQAQLAAQQAQAAGGQPTA